MQQLLLPPPLPLLLLLPLARHELPIRKHVAYGGCFERCLLNDAVAWLLACLLVAAWWRSLLCV